MKRTNQHIDWGEIRRLRRRGFHGEPLSAEDLRKCERAMKADPKRYGDIGAEVRDEYRRSFSGW